MPKFIERLKPAVMKYSLLLVCMMIAFTSHAQTNADVSLRSILLEQLKTTHNVKDWFVPPTIAVAGLTAEQANWHDNTENHSIAQLTTHLIFWNKQVLDKLTGVKPDAFSGNNKETFSPVTPDSWAATVKTLDSVLTALEDVVKNADDKKLSAIASTIAHVGTHNAYHTGQIIYIRKMKGWWDDNNGVK